MISTALRAHLAADATIASLVGTRIYPTRLPQNPAFPAMTYSQIAGPQIATLEGCVAHNPHFQINCFSETYLTALQLADAVEDSINLFMGVMNSEEIVSASIKMNREDIFEENVDDYRVALDFSIWHRAV